APEERTDEDNITILQRSLQKDPGNVIIMLQLADLYIKTNDNKSAKKTLEKVLEIDPYNKDAAEGLKKLE
ncbi:MAG TPA: tetratricopeptide repeat protein, partial [Ignavibacteria bacterium]|nr:tetratricopeptide repeat protein [Ignavibacteria bacterium]